MRWSLSIAIMSRWFALKRTSSSSGKSHSKRTIRVCTSLKTLVTLSSPIIQPMSWSSTASRNGRVLVRLSILSTDRMATLFLSLNASVPTRIQWFLKFYFQGFPGSCRSPYCPNTSLVSPGPTPNFNLPILPISLCLSPGKLSELSLVQTPHLCLQDLLPTSACRDTLNVHLQASCRSFHCPNTLCLQDLLPTSACRDTLNVHLQASCRSFHCPNTSLVSPGPTPNLSLSRYSQSFQKKCRFRQSIDKSPSSNDLTANMPKMKWNKNTSPRSRILKLFDALDFTSAAYQSSDHCRTSVQAQHVSLQKIQELNTKDLSFTLDGALSTLQQGSAENGVGSPVELRYHVKKRRAQICGQIKRLIKFLQDYASRRVRQTRTSNISAERKSRT